MNTKIKVCVGYVVGGEPLSLPDGEYVVTAHQPEGEAVPAKVASVDTHEFQCLLDSLRLAITLQEFNRKAKTLISHIDAKLAEALNRQAKLIHEGDLGLMNELQVRAEKAEADLAQKQAEYALLAEAGNKQVEEFNRKYAVLAAQVPQAGQAPTDLQIMEIWHKADQPCEENDWTTGVVPFARMLLKSVPQQAGQAVDVWDIRQAKDARKLRAAARAVVSWLDHANCYNLPDDGELGSMDKDLRALRDAIPKALFSDPEPPLAAPPASAAPVGQVALPRFCPCCYVKDIEYQRICHNSDCEKYGCYESVFRGWK